MSDGNDNSMLPGVDFPEIPAGGGTSGYEGEQAGEPYDHQSFLPGILGELAKGGSNHT